MFFLPASNPKFQAFAKCMCDWTVIVEESNTVQSSENKERDQSLATERLHAKEIERIQATIKDKRKEWRDGRDSYNTSVKEWTVASAEISLDVIGIEDAVLQEQLERAEKKADLIRQRLALNQKKVAIANLVEELVKAKKDWVSTQATTRLIEDRIVEAGQKSIRKLYDWCKKNGKALDAADKMELADKQNLLDMNKKAKEDIAKQDDIIASIYEVMGMKNKMVEWQEEMIQELKDQLKEQGEELEKLRTGGKRKVDEVEEEVEEEMRGIKKRKIAQGSRRLSF